MQKRQNGSTFGVSTAAHTTAAGTFELARSPIRQPTRRASTQGAPVNSYKYPQASATEVCSESYPTRFIIAIGGWNTVNSVVPGRRCIFSCLRAGERVARDNGHDFQLLCRTGKQPRRKNVQCRRQRNQDWIFLRQPG